jgi:DHA2 family multidrug resistance protein-like MFS transporter
MTPASPSPIPSARRRWIVLAVLATSLLLLAMDNTVLNVALPTLATDLAADSTELLWIVDAYSLVLAGLLVAMGTLADRIGRRRLLCAGFALFAVASIVTAFTETAEQLIAARVLLGVGGAMIMPSTLAILRTVFTDERERALAIGVWTATAAGGFAVGPVIGGAILEIAHWSWVFLINVPIVLTGLVLIRRLVPESRGAAGRPWDVPSVALSIAGMAALVWGIKEVGKNGLDAAPGLAAVAAGGAVLAAFVVRQNRLRVPLLDVGLFRARSFATAAVAVLLTFFGIGGLLLLLSQFLQVVQGHGPLATGVRLLPLALAAAVGGMATDALVRRFGAHVTVGGAFALVAGALGGFATVGAATAYPLIALWLAILGLGAGVAATAGTVAIMAAAPPDRAGGASAIQETAFELGGALGVALIGSLASSVYRGELTAVPAAARDSLPAAAEVAERVGGTAGAAVLEAASGAFVDGLTAAALAGAAVMAVAAVVAWRVLPRVRAAA